MTTPPVPSKRTVHGAAGLIRRGEEILLVHQQDHDDPESNWALPGGVVERDELVIEALVREIREETGLIVEPPFRLLYVAQHEDAHESILALIYEIENWTGELASDDPDGEILEPRWLPENDAIARLERLSWRVMREPIVSYLRNETGPGASWFYRAGKDNEAMLVTRIEGY
ncbi:NUDIX hydrolase [soil metagenome]